VAEGLAATADVTPTNPVAPVDAGVGIGVWYGSRGLRTESEFARPHYNDRADRTSDELTGANALVRAA